MTDSLSSAGAPAGARDLTRAQLDHVAELASLSLEDAEAEALAAELNRIVGYLTELDAVDTTGVPPTSGVTSSVLEGPTEWRADEVTPGISHEDALAQAPRASRGGFAVPAFVDPHGAGSGARR